MQSSLRFSHMIYRELFWGIKSIIHVMINVPLHSKNDTERISGNLCIVKFKNFAYKKLDKSTY